MHVCPTERDWMCVILKRSTTLYYGILGVLAIKYQTHVLHVDSIRPKLDYHKRGPNFGVGGTLFGVVVSLQIAPKSVKMNCNISSFLYCF